MNRRADGELGRFTRFCETHLRLEDGRPLVIEDFQKQMLRDYFTDTTETVILVPKKHYPRVRAASREQAGIPFNQAGGFVRRSDWLKVAIVDEVARHRSAELYGTLRDGLGPRQGRLIGISTAGDDEGSPLGRMRKAAYKLPTVERDAASLTDAQASPEIRRAMDFCR